MKQNRLLPGLVGAVLMTGSAFCYAAAPVETNASSAHQYTASVVPANMTVQEKKARFIALIEPAVQAVYTELDAQYVEVSGLIERGEEAERITRLKEEYKASTDDELLMALKPFPQSIALAQAAMESAWATSRFFREANNIFGVWSFNANEPRIAAGEKRGDKTIWVKKYASIDDAVRDYYRVLARGNAFKGFRQEKMKSNDPFLLVKQLDKYSEKGAEYGKELASMIRYNKFERFDR